MQISHGQPGQPGFESRMYCHLWEPLRGENEIFFGLSVNKEVFIKASFSNPSLFTPLLGKMQ